MARTSRRPRDATPIVRKNLYLEVALERLEQDQHDLDALETVGVWYLAQGQAEKALLCFHRVTTRNPAYPGIWRLKAKAFEALGDRRNAAMCWKRGSDPWS